MRARPKSKGSIRCEVIRAEGLKPADKNGLSDPFVTITLGWDQANGSWRTRKSEVVRKSLNPVFDWSCSFGYESFYDALRNEKIVVQVFDWDKLSFNDPLGDCTVGSSARICFDSQQERPLLCHSNWRIDRASQAKYGCS